LENEDDEQNNEDYVEGDEEQGEDGNASEVFTSDLNDTDDKKNSENGDGETSEKE
jgi:hypothetical protein